jgi:hypothetical protein
LVKKSKSIITWGWREYITTELSLSSPLLHVCHESSAYFNIDASTSLITIQTTSGKGSKLGSIQVFQMNISIYRNGICALVKSSIPWSFLLQWGSYEDLTRSQSCMVMHAMSLATMTYELFGGMLLWFKVWSRQRVMLMVQKLKLLSAWRSSATWRQPMTGRHVSFGVLQRS